MLENAYKTLFCLFTIAVLGPIFHFIISIPERLSPITNKIDDFELSDIAFAYSQASVDPDPAIVILNISHDSVQQIAEKISDAVNAEASVIGLDIIFSGTANSAATLRLIDTINCHKSKIVLAAAFDDKTSDPIINEFYEEMQNRNDGEGSYNWGYVEMAPADKTRRNFLPIIEHNGNYLNSFAVSLIKTAAKDTARLLNNVFSEQTVINFRNCRAQRRYLFFDSVPGNEYLIKGKIILFGSLDTSRIEDMHYTPLNKIIGRSLPDMHGTEMLAQITSMIIARDYITVPSEKIKLTLRVFLCFLYVFLFSWGLKKHALYHFISEGAFLVSIILFLFMSGILLNTWKIKFEPVDYLIPIFLCSLILPLYEPAMMMFRKIFDLISKKRN